MSFLYGDELAKAIRETVSGEGATGVRIAVAFWGNDAPDLLDLRQGGDWKIICNLSMGGTSPEAIRFLENPGRGGTKRIRECSLLHAKVYLSDERAVVCSANASANGLGHEGKEMRGWHEAGMLVEDPAELGKIQKWFDDLWKECKPVTKRMLDEAASLRRRIRSRRPGTLATLNPDADDVPLISWYYPGSELDLDQDEIKYQTGDYSEYIKRRISDGVLIEHEQDRDLLAVEGRWILWFRRENKRLLPKWYRLSDTVCEKGVSLNGKTYPCVLASTDQSGEPFKLTKEVKEILAEILSLRKYNSILEHREPFYTNHLHLMRDIWRELKKRAL